MPLRSSRPCLFYFFSPDGLLPDAVARARRAMLQKSRYAARGGVMYATAPCLMLPHERARKICAAATPGARAKMRRSAMLARALRGAGAHARRCARRARLKSLKSLKDDGLKAL